MKDGKRVLPKHVRVGPFRYRVVIEPGRFRDDSDEGWLQGEADHLGARIRVMQSNPRQMYAILWHELLHAIDNLAGTDLSEDQVSRLAPILAGVLLDNPRVRTLPSEGDRR